MSNDLWDEPLFIRDKGSKLEMTPLGYKMFMQSHGINVDDLRYPHEKVWDGFQYRAMANDEQTIKQDQ